MTRVCAIDLGARELKLMEADGRLLTYHAEVLLPDGALIDGIPTPLLTAAVRGAFEAAWLSPPRGRGAAPGNRPPPRAFSFSPRPTCQHHRARLLCAGPQESPAVAG